MNSNDLTCDKCKKIIPEGTSYFCLTRNIETISHNIATNEDEIEVIDSEEFFIFCGDCGNKFNPEVLAKVLKAVPLDNSQIKDN